MNKTIRLYEDNQYLKSCNATVLSAFTCEKPTKEEPSVENGVDVCLILDKTIFFPEGGGQPSDKGTITGDFGEFRIEYVFEKDGKVHHLGHFTKDCDTAHLVEIASISNKTVNCQLDWERRFSHMQRHCGEHILSAAFFDLYGGINRGFHMGADYMTIDISLEEDNKYQQMTDEMIQNAEWISNKMVWDNLPVTISRFESREEALARPMRKKLTLEEDIVLVCVGDENNAAGCVACCGTHPRNTGEVGLIKIFRWENYKGMTRITFDAGPIALKHCRESAEIIRDLSIHYSSDPGMLMDNIRKRERKNSEVRHELFELKQAYLTSLCSDIIEELDKPNTVIIKEYNILKTDDLLNLGKMLPEIPSKLVVLVSSKENTLIMLSNGTPDCNKIVKDNAPVWNGKGGGRANSARAMFPNPEDINCFLDFLQKAY